MNFYTKSYYHLNTNFAIKENFLSLFDALLLNGYFFYLQYLKLGKKFFCACIIKENNMRIEKLIIENAPLFPIEQKNDLMLIVYHLESWRAQWECLYKKSQPNFDDEFVFDTLIKFPKESLARLDEYYFSNFNKNFT